MWIKFLESLTITFLPQVTHFCGAVIIFSYLFKFYCISLPHWIMILFKKIKPLYLFKTWFFAQQVDNKKTFVLGNWKYLLCLVSLAKHTILSCFFFFFLSNITFQYEMWPWALYSCNIYHHVQTCGNKHTLMQTTNI